jgi:hypothetical protein
MSESEPSARPRQLTVAGGFVIAGSVILLFAIFDAITNLQSVDTRDEVSRMLSQTGNGLGLTVSETLSGMRFGLMVAAACAAASAVLGIFVLQRHRGARVALSVLAVPILLTSPLTGGVLGALVAMATLALWSGPARDWFAGRPVREPLASARREREEPTPRPAPREDFPPPAPPPSTGPVPTAPSDRPAPEGPSASDVSTEQTSTLPPATPGFGRPSAHQASGAAPQPWAALPPAPADWSAPGPRTSPPSPVPVPVPVPVKVACLLTWVFAGVVALMYAVVLGALVVAKDQVVDYVVSSPEWDRANLDSDLILPVLWLGCLMFFAWAAGAVVLAWFTWRRHNWARYLLVGSAGAAMVAALFAFPVGLFHQAACAATIAGLFSVRAREWFARPTRGPGPPYGPPPGQYGPPPPGNQAGPPPQEWPQNGPQDRPQNRPQNGPGKPPVW